METQCTGTTVSGQRCRKAPIPGGTVCRLHGGAAPQVRAKAMVRAELMNWGLGDTDVDPTVVMLRLISQSANRAEFLANLLAEQYERATAGQETTTLPARISVLVGRQFALNRNGDPVPVAEAIRALVELENAERDRLCTFTTRAIAAGLATRQVELAERTGEMMAEVLRAVLGDESLGLSESQVALVPALLREHLAIAS